MIAHKYYLCFFMLSTNEVHMKDGGAVGHVIGSGIPLRIPGVSENTIQSPSVVQTRAIMFEMSGTTEEHICAS